MHAICLFAGHDGGQVVLWRLDTSSHLLLGPSHANAVSCLAPALTAKGDELLLSGSYDGCVSLWEPRHLRGVKPHLLARWGLLGSDTVNCGSLFTCTLIAYLYSSCK
jgi:WD40 repeat protein